MNMVINGLIFPDKPTPKLLTPDINRLIKHYVSKYKSKKVSALNHHDLVGYLTDFELITLSKEDIEKGAGGYFSRDKKVIALSAVDSAPLSILCHEIGHSIQNELDLIPQTRNTPLSEVLRMEQQCETIGMKLYYSLPFEKTETREWDAYFLKEDVEFLSMWCNGYYQNDLL